VHVCVIYFNKRRLRTFFPNNGCMALNEVCSANGPFFNFICTLCNSQISRLQNLKKPYLTSWCLLHCPLFAFDVCVRGRPSHTAYPFLLINTGVFHSTIFLFIAAAFGLGCSRT
jgi:hypothetical protein